MTKYNTMAHDKILTEFASKGANRMIIDNLIKSAGQYFSFREIVPEKDDYKKYYEDVLHRTSLINSLEENKRADFINELADESVCKIKTK